MKSDIITEIREELGVVFLRILLPLSSIGTVLLVLRRIFFGTFTPGPSLVLAALVITIVLGWLLALRKEYYKASLFVSGALLSVSLLGTLINGGVLAPAFVGTMVPLTFFAWLSSRRLSMILLGITLSLGLLTTLYPLLGIDTGPAERAPALLLIHYTVFFSIVVTTATVGSKMLREALNKSEEQRRFLERTFALLEDMVVVYTDDFQIVKVNRKADEFCERHGIEQPEFFDLQVVLEGAREVALKTFLTEQEEDISNLRIQVSFDNKLYWFILAASSFSFSGVYTLLVLRDITEEIEREHTLAQAQKMDVVGQLASGIAHDFNNMLSGIQGAAELLSFDAREDQKQMVNIISVATEKASKLTKELLVFSRKSPRVSTAVDVHAIIEETTFLLKRTIDKRIELISDCTAHHSLVVGDDTMIQSAFMNMGINASHAMPDGGTLFFRTSTIELDWLFCSHSQFELEPGEYLSVEITDTGSGMPLEIQKRIFEPFFTTKEVGKGTGLGMAAVYGMVVEHKGAITVYSEVGRGTTFQILLPLDTDGDVGAREVVRTVVPGTGIILLVDDEEFIRITATALLRSFGYEVYAVGNGEEALDFLSDQSVDLVILDMIMPVMNGRETFEKIIERRPEQKVILSSGFSKEEDVQAMKAKGLFGFIHKPYQRSELSQIVAEAMKISS